MSSFEGESKAVMDSLTSRVERKFIDYVTPKLAKYVSGYQLTLLTIPWILLLLYAGYKATENLNWMWVAIAIIILQWFTDSLDGSVGKHNREGRPRWGFYMDHLLDYFFLCAMWMQYAFLLPNQVYLLTLSAIAAGGTMVSEFLLFPVLRRFQVTYGGFGPTEVRGFFVIVNLGIVFLGTSFLPEALPALLAITLLILIMQVVKCAKLIQAIDGE